MTREEAKSELMQIYMSLSEEKKQALDVLMAQADGKYIRKSDMIDWLKDIRHKMKPQNYHTASEFEIAENQIWNLIQMLQMSALPSVAIPNKVGHWEYNQYDGNPNIGNWHCSECRNIVSDMPTCMGKPLYEFCPNCGCRMVEPQERSEE